MNQTDEDDNQLDPPAGLTFSNIIPVTSLIVDKIGCNGYQILETPHAQEKYVNVVKHRQRRTYPRARSYFSAELTAKRLRVISNSGIAEDLEQFFERNPKAKNLVNLADSKKRTALHFAASRGSDELVHLLLQQGADPNLQDLNGNTPLHLAACTHHIRIITLLLRYGANVKMTDSTGKTPLNISVSRLRMLSSRKLDHNGQCSNRTSSFSIEKRKADVAEIIAMLTEYFDKAGKKDDYFKMCEMKEQLLAVETDEGVDQVNDLLRNFTQMTIDHAANSKLPEE